MTPNGPKTLLMGMLHDYMSCWTTLGPSQGGPTSGQSGVVTISLIPSDHLRAVGTESGPSGPLSSFSPSYGLLEAKWALLGPPVGTQMAPGWSNMTYNPVIYPWEVF